MKLSTQIFLGFLIAISIDLLDSFVNYTLTLKVKTDSDFLNRSEAIIRNSGALNKGIVDMQSAFRGYLLTEDERFLPPYYDGLMTLPRLINRERLTLPMPIQLRILDSIENLHNLWVGYADGLIVAKKKSVVGGTADLKYQYLFETQLKKGEGKEYNDKITDLFRVFDETEYRIREQRRLSLSESIDKTDKYSLMFSILLVVAGFGIAAYLIRKISRRIQSLVRLAEKISSGNFSAIRDDKNDELSSPSVSLNEMSEKLNRNITELKKRNAELDQFAYVVSHDLKAPVRGVANVLQWMEEDHGEDISLAIRKYLNMIRERMKRLESLIDGLLEYARVGRKDALKEEVDVAILIRELAELIVSPEYKLITTTLPILYTEKLLLQQVFGNLISNAITYAPSEGGEITISCEEDESFYEFSVRDNGPGIDAMYHERIFVIFQTLREKNDHESTGIGLAIVKKIIEEKQCAIRVISSPGKGANFIFTWPKK